MILYDSRKWHGYYTLFQMKGSVLPRITFRCLLAAVAVFPINEWDLIYFPRSPYAHQVFTFGLSFLVIMRTSLAYSRYWDGVTDCYLMHAKWFDAAVMIVAFDELAKPPANETIQIFKKQMLHLFSLLGACAVLNLHGYEEEEDAEALDYVQMSKSQLDLLVPFEEQHREQGSPQSSPTSSTNPSPQEVLTQDEDPNKVIKAEHLSLGNDEGEGETLEHLPILGALDETTRAGLIENCEHQVHHIMTRIIRLVTQRMDEGGVAIPPPILSRVYQELSTGLLGFTHAKKVGDIPFPFPYSQIVSFLQLCFLFSCPFVVMALISEPIPAMLFTFFAAFCYSSLNEVAAELEDPFGTDANDLPLFKLHLRYVHQLVQLGDSDVTKEDLLTLVKGPEKIEERQRQLEEREMKEMKTRGMLEHWRQHNMARGWNSWREQQIIFMRQRALLERAARGMVARAYGKWFLKWYSGISAEELLLKKLLMHVEKLKKENKGIYHAGEFTISETLQLIFGELDIDRSNSLQHHEVVSLCQRLGVECSDEKFENLLKKIDPKQSDRVTFDMFLTWYVQASQKFEARERERQAGRDQVIAAAKEEARRASMEEPSSPSTTFGTTEP